MCLSKSSHVYNLIFWGLGGQQYFFLLLLLFCLNTPLLSDTLFSFVEPDGKKATFRSDYEYEIECEYNFQISNQSRSWNRCSSLLVTLREGVSRNKIGVTHYYLKHASNI